MPPEVLFLCVQCSDCVEWLKQEKKMEGEKERREREGWKGGSDFESKKSQIIQACNMSTVHITVRA